jgi:hypothetical protein
MSVLVTVLALLGTLRVALALALALVLMGLPTKGMGYPSVSAKVALWEATVPS